MAKVTMIVLAVVALYTTSAHAEPLEALRLSPDSTKLLLWQLQAQLPTGAIVRSDSAELTSYAVSRGRAQLLIDVHETYLMAGSDFPKNVRNNLHQPIKRIRAVGNDMVVYGTKHENAVKGVAPGSASARVYTSYVLIKNNTVKRLEFSVYPVGDSSYAWAEFSEKISSSVGVGRNVLNMRGGRQYAFPGYKFPTTIDVPKGFVAGLIGGPHVFRLTQIGVTSKPVTQSMCDIGVNSNPVPGTVDWADASEIPAVLLNRQITWNVTRGRKTLHAARTSVERLPNIRFYVFCTASQPEQLRTLMSTIESLDVGAGDYFGEVTFVVPRTP